MTARITPAERESIIQMLATYTFADVVRLSKRAPRTIARIAVATMGEAA